METELRKARKTEADGDDLEAGEVGERERGGRAYQTDACSKNIPQFDLLDTPDEEVRRIYLVSLH